MGQSPEQEFTSFLRDREILSAAQIRRLENYRLEKKRSVGQSLLDLTFMDEATFLGHWASMRNLPLLSRGDLKPAPEVLGLVSRETCAQFVLLPLRLDGDRLVVASSDPTNILAEDELRFLVGRDITWAAAESDPIRGAIFEAYPRGEEGAQEPLEEDFSPVLAEVQRILQEAVNSGATHVHLEPSKDAFTIYFRVEGSLREIRRLPKNLQAPITARLKILGELDISERRRPQSGKFQLRESGGSVTFRIATLPTAFHRERIGLSVLRSMTQIPPPERLGFDPDVSSRLEKQARTRAGLLIVAGAAASGRTTTLYSLASSVAAAGRKVISIEDRVDREMPEFTQVEARASDGFTLSMALRHALRQDAEVLLLDPLLDSECLETALSAATEGRLVIVGLHARTPEGALERLACMTRDPFLLGSELRGIFVQKLLRALCPSCREPERITREIASRYSLKTTSLFKPKGCEACRGVGFRGQVPVGHLVEIGAAHRQRLLAGSGGMPPSPAGGPIEGDGLRRAILAKVESGTTSLEEALGHLD